MIHLAQIAKGDERRVALVDEPHLRCLAEVQSVYELADGCLRHGCGLAARAQTLAKGEALDYEVRGLTAGTYQHEVDHLDGKLFVDRVVDTRTLCTWADFERFYMAGFVERAKALVAKFGS